MLKQLMQSVTGHRDRTAERPPEAGMTASHMTASHMTASHRAAKTPYDLPGYAEAYDAAYLTAPFTDGHTRFETDLVARTCRKWPAPHWCDVCCGTGHHLRRTPGTIRRTGVDRSKAMLNVARNRPGHDADFHCRDARAMDGLGPFDLVTSFWYGYLHQNTLDEVLDLLSCMQRAVRPGGDLILGVCNPFGLFETVALENPMVYGEPMQVQAIVWGYTEPGGARFDNCIAPHPQLILDHLAPGFAEARWLDYPVLDASPDWRRKGLHLQNRRAEEDHAP